MQSTVLRRLVNAEQSSTRGKRRTGTWWREVFRRFQYEGPILIPMGIGCSLVSNRARAQARSRASCDLLIIVQRFESSADVVWVALKAGFVAALNGIHLSPTSAPRPCVPGCVPTPGNSTAQSVGSLPVID